MSFAGLTINKSVVPANIGSRLLQMGVRAFGIKEDETRHIVSQMLTFTESYPDRIQLLVQASQVPKNVADYLIQQLVTIRRFIQQALI